nr:hypothetical protein Iba_chr13dCG2390 [Ipomoea batatas]
MATCLDLVDLDFCERVLDKRGIPSLMSSISAPREIASISGKEKGESFGCLSKLSTARDCHNAYLFLVVGGSRLGRWRRWAAGLEAAAGGLGLSSGRGGMGGGGLAVPVVDSSSAGGGGRRARASSTVVPRFCIACIRKSKIFQSPLKLHNTSSQCYKSLPLAYAYLFLVVGGSRLGRWRRWAAGLEAAAGGLGCRLGEADGRWRAGLSGRRLVVGWVEAGGRGVVDRRTTYAIRREERARDVWGQGLRSCVRVGYLAGL